MVLLTICNGALSKQSVGEHKTIGSHELWFAEDIEATLPFHNKRRPICGCEHHQEWACGDTLQVVFFEEGSMFYIGVVVEGRQVQTTSSSRRRIKGRCLKVFFFHRCLQLFFSPGADGPEHFSNVLFVYIWYLFMCYMCLPQFFVVLFVAAHGRAIAIVVPSNHGVWRKGGSCFFGLGFFSIS